MDMNMCIWCKKAFIGPLGGKVCKDCHPRDREQFHIIEDYLMEHPGKNAIELSKELHVEMAILLAYVEEGRLVPVASPIFKEIEPE